jgi:hypothetical protein
MPNPDLPHNLKMVFFFKLSTSSRIKKSNLENPQAKTAKNYRNFKAG